ncbi:hypothetical protein [Cypionkella sp. TWP1-2-1b2]|uniref:hypothetical protein n=1 Tax=Cypionkella sp. TWP1-2-1b2 TaxID=2804675 RepID=UPI003CECF063
MTAWLFVKAIPYLIGLMALVGLYLRGRHNGVVKAHRDTLERYQKTRKAMDDVEAGDDPDAAKRWLRERGK